MPLILATILRLHRLSVCIDLDATKQGANHETLSYPHCGGEHCDQH